MDPTKTHVVHDFKHSSPLISCRFDPSGKYVFFGAEDFGVWRVEIATGEKVKFPAEAWVRGLDFTSDGKTLLTAGYDGRLIWWSVAAEKPTPVRAVEAHKGWARAVAVSPDDALVATVGNDLVVRLWKMDDGALLREMSGHESHIYNVAFHPDGTRLATGDLKCNVFDWEVATGKRVRNWEAPSLRVYDKTFKATIGGFRGMAFSPDGKFLGVSGITKVTNAFAGVGNPSVVVFDWKAGKQQIEHLSKGKLRGVAWGVVFHPEGLRIGASGGSGGYLMFWKPDTAEAFHQVNLKNNARDLDLSPDGLHVATAHHDGHVRVSLMDEKKS
jgi:WD40 repeat protein